MSNLYRIVFAGFGGQGVMSMGQLLTYAGMIEEKNVSWCPSYGPEMRGGTANCSVIISDELITSPVIANNATTAVIMNEASYDKFVNSVIPGGSIYINSSLVKRKVQREDVTVYYVLANDIAKTLGNPKLINVVMLGALIEKEKIVQEESIVEAFKKVFGEAKEKFIPINREALKKGSEVVSEIVA